MDALFLTSRGRFFPGYFCVENPEHPASDPEYSDAVTLDADALLQAIRHKNTVGAHLAELEREAWLSALRDDGSHPSEMESLEAARQEYQAALRPISQHQHARRVSLKWELEWAARALVGRLQVEE